MREPVLDGDGFVLRPWRDDDLDALAEMNADPVAMAHFPATVDRVRSASFIDREREALIATGMGLRVIDLEGRFAGFVGLSRVTRRSPIHGEVEVGWGLARWAWGRGLATRGARLAIEDGRRRLGVGDVYAATSVRNVRSAAVMVRLGMVRRPDLDYVLEEFPDWPGSPHVVYELVR